MTAALRLRARCRGIRSRIARVRQWRETEAGQTLVEFSLILPVFLLLLFALVDFGRGFYTWLLVTNAAREGARAAAVQSDATTVDAKLYGSFCPNWPSTAGCGLDTAKVSRSVVNLQGTRGTETKVTVNFTFTYVTPIGAFMSLVGGDSISAPTISSTTSMRLE